VQVLGLSALGCGTVYLAWRVMVSGRGTPLAPFLVLLAAELFGWLNLALYVFLAWSVPRSRQPALSYPIPSIDVFVCTYDESLTVLEATLIGCRAIRLPHTTHLLDDGRRPEVEALAARLGIRYVTRDDNAHAKAGNINHALRTTHGELILFLDADHVPMPGVLESLAGYFRDPQLALVQTPQDFSNRDSVQHTRLERHEQALFFEVIAPGKDRHNGVFWCGSATLMRRAALEQIGGVLTDTVAEDFHTTVALHARGWRTRYHDEVLVQGLAPHDLGGFLLQRARWARGNLRVFRTSENPVTCRGLSGKQRLSYLASLLNYFSGLQRLALLLVLAWTLTTGQLPMHASVLMLLVLWLPWSLLALGSTAALGRGTLGVFDSTRYGIMTMGIYIGGVTSIVSGRAGAFRVTPKEGVDEGGLQVLRMLKLVTAAFALLLTAWLVRVASWLGVLHAPDMPELARIITLLLGVWELACIAAVVGSLVRRRQVRSQYRFPVRLRARISSTPTIVPLLDLTPGGLAFESPVGFDQGARFHLLTRVPDASGTIRELTLRVEVTSCRLNDNGTKYRVGCRLDPTDTETRALLVEYCFVVMPDQQHHGVVDGGPTVEVQPAVPAYMS
jgi:cellulose synthase/poly-beta-1,6-N-acetylglucosamine synthase-like glycosyltransferase